MSGNLNAPFPLPIWVNVFWSWNNCTSYLRHINNVHSIMRSPFFPPTGSIVCLWWFSVCLFLFLVLTNYAFLKNIVFSHRFLLRCFTTSLAYSPLACVCSVIYSVFQGKRGTSGWGKCSRPRAIGSEKALLGNDLSWLALRRKSQEEENGLIG